MRRAINICAATVAIVATGCHTPPQPSPCTTIALPSHEDRAAAAGWGHGTWMDQHQDICHIGEVRTVDVVFLGDSITQSWGGRGRNVGAPAQPIWDEHFRDRNAANFGIAGDRTQHVLWRIGHGNFEHIDPRTIVLMIGTNNLGRDTPEHIAAGIEAIVDRLEVVAPDAIVLLCSIVRGRDGDDPLRRDADRANELISALGSRGRVQFIDMGAIFYDANRMANPDLMRGDFIHFTPAGYRVWAQAVMQHL